VSNATTIVGYCDPLVVEPGDRVALMIRSHVPGTCTVRVARLLCGDPSSKGPGYRTEDTTFEVPPPFQGRDQPLRPGSFVVVDVPAALADRMATATGFEVTARIYATRPGDDAQALLGSFDASSGTGFALQFDDAGACALRIGATVVSTGVPVVPRRWYDVTARWDGATGTVTVVQTPLPTRAPGDALSVHAGSATATVAPPPGSFGSPDVLRMAAWAADGHHAAPYDGRIEAPALSVTCADGSRVQARWDFAVGIGSTRVVDVGPHGLHGRTVGGPARAVTSSSWDGSTQRWSDKPEQYAAIHFHRDDLVDAGWEPDATVTVPRNARSGVYVFETTGPDGNVDRTPFFVRPPADGPHAALAFLVPTATYYAYANHRMTIDGSDFFAPRDHHRPEIEYLKQHPECGHSMYEYHDDGSGVMLSSRRRPVMNMKPGADGWAFTADTNIVAFLEHLGIPYDVITDDDVHREGVALLGRYRCVVTGSHPEYTSTAMLDAFEAFTATDGRFVYLGGNGFYWRVSWSEEEPWIMEIRRAEDGTRAWIAEPGEYYHAHGGEYGGLWRRLGRAPNRLVGIGFAAQGFDRASHYRRSAESHDGRAAWIFEGVEDQEIVGDHGVGGGAAGQEIDRFDLALGSPHHVVVLASSEDHSAQMLRTKEEYHATVVPGPEDPAVRADLVFFETPNGGAVFSTGSISWFGALATRGRSGELYDNDIARITANVVRRFVDPTPIPPPPG